MKFTIYSLALFAIVLSCDKQESMAVENHQQNPEVIEYQTDPAGLTLQDIQCRVETDKLSFENVGELKKALSIVRKTNEGEVLTWLNGLGFRSHLHTYVDALEKFKRNNDVPATELLPNTPLLVEGEDNVSVNSPDLGLAALTNDDGELLVAGDLNVFRKDFHLLVDEADADLYATALETREGNPEKGVYFTAIATSQVSQETYEGEKTQVKYYSSCPVNAPSSLGHRIERNTDSRRRMECYINQMAVAVTVTQTTFGPIWGFMFETNLVVANKRKQGLKWIRTFPDFMVSNGEIGSNSVFGEVIVNRLVNFVNTSDNFSFFPHSHIGVASNGDLDSSPAYSGVADLTLEIDSKAVDVDFSNLLSACPTCVYMGNIYRINDGNIQVKWTNHDTGMDIKLGCP
ncbi:MAG: hypothetical protein R2795_23865 [Saprospiraceae bacterium]